MRHRHQKTVKKQTCRHRRMQSKLGVRHAERNDGPGRVTPRRLMTGADGRDVRRGSENESAIVGPLALRAVMSANDERRPSWTRHRAAAGGKS